MNSIDTQYQILLQSILDYGTYKSDRTGTGTKSIFGYTIRHRMSDGFPILTTKKVSFKNIVVELLWFLRGDTNIKYLLDNGCNIWTGDAYKSYREARPNDRDAYTIEEFAEQIKTNPEFAARYGELGPIYSKQWRSWVSDKDMDYGTETSVDQIANLINDLKTNPDSRRLIVSAWNVGELDQMVLPPCHYGFQVYTRELSKDERYKVLEDRPMGDKRTIGIGNIDPLELNNIPTRAISLMWSQRSADVFLGIPYNIASYALLLEILAKEVNMIPDELVGNLGDTHLYLNHIEQAKEQIDREPFELPKLGMDYREAEYDKNLTDFVPDDFYLIDYQSHPAIKAPLSN
jgi:thymidylate synthase